MVIDSIPKVAGMAYAIVASILIVVLLRRGKFSRRVGYLFLVFSVIFGFLVFAPMLPYQFQTLLLGNVKGLGAPIALAVVVLVAFVVLAFAFGRTFCGYVCPIGAVQELPYLLPLKKLEIRGKTISTASRLLVLVTFVVLALVLSVGILRYLGVRDFFYLEFGSGLFYIFLALVVASAFLYRPFCRFLCPYGALLSLAAGKSRFRLRRTDACTDCGTCETVCPTNEAGRGDSKQECYLCNRCKEVCPENAIQYGRRPASEVRRQERTPQDLRTPGTGEATEKIG
jgi:ferredoxin-type protein NapH